MRRGVPLAVIALLVGGGSVAYASSSGGGPTYRTATAQLGDVEQVLHLTGQLSPVHQLSAAFPTAGTVATVPVHLGELVQAGQTLATLNPTPLQYAVTQAQAGLASAQATLAADQSSSAPAAPAPTTPAPASHNTPHTATGPLQQAVTHDLAQAAAALQQLKAACAAPAPAATPTATPSPTPSSQPSASPSSRPSTSKASHGSAGAGPGSCVTAATATMAAQQQVATDEGRLLKAATANSNAAAIPSAPRPPSTSGSGRSSAGNVGTDTANVLTAQATLDNANAALAGAVLHSPLTGTLAALPFTVGSPTSPAAHAVVIASGALSAAVSVPGTEIGRVRLGQRATVTPDGSTTAMPGAVNAVGLLPSSSNAPISYAVTVLVPNATANLGSGATGSVDIVTGSATQVLTLPVSAVTPTGSGSTGMVNVLSGGHTLTPTPVQLGVVGSGLVQITSGLKVGATVVLADLAQPLPSNTTVNRRLFGGRGPGGPKFGGPKFGGAPLGGRAPAGRGG